MQEYDVIVNSGGVVHVIHPDEPLPFGDFTVNGKILGIDELTEDENEAYNIVLERQCRLQSEEIIAVAMPRKQWVSVLELHGKGVRAYADTEENRNILHANVNPIVRAIGGQCC